MIATPFQVAEPNATGLDTRASNVRDHASTGSGEFSCEITKLLDLSFEYSIWLQQTRGDVR